MDSRQLLLDFGEKIVKDGNLDKATAAQITRMLKQWQNVTDESIRKFLDNIAPEVRRQLKKAYYQYTRSGYKISFSKIKPYRITEMKPELRKELELAIENSINLITSQSAEFKAQMERRFINWVTIPSPDTRGNTSAQALKKLNEALKEIQPDKPDKHQKMIIVDQTRKMIGNMDNIIASNGGAIGFIWRTRRDLRVVGNPVGLYPKPTRLHGDHYDREGKLYLLADSWALKKGFIKKTKDVTLDINIEDGKPSTAPNCRCYGEYIFNLEDIPAKYRSIITKKGNEYLNGARF